MRDHGLRLDAQQRDTLEARKRLHDGLNKFIGERGGWQSRHWQSFIAIGSAEIS